MDYNEVKRKTDCVERNSNATMRMDVRSDKQRRNHERIHPRNNNETDAGVQQTISLYGRMMSRDEEHMLRKCRERRGRRKRERPKTRCKNACQRDVKSTELIACDETDRDLHDGKSQEKRRKE